MRNPETTKHDYGHGLLIAGAYGRMGCAILAARAALRSGCGLVTAHLPSRCVDPMQAAFPEAMVSIDPSETLFTTPPPQLERYTAVAVGPGIGTDEATCNALHRLLQYYPLPATHYPLPATRSVLPATHSPLPATRYQLPNTRYPLPATCYPLILDADALNILAMHRDWLPLAAGAVVTPHAREYGRLFGDADPADMARQYGLIIVKKAHHTHVYSPDGRVYVNHTGNAGMATAGSGDVLTGILLGMLCACRGGDNHPDKDLFPVVCRAVEIHGKTGDFAIEKQTESSLIASDLIDSLRYITTDITEH